MRALKPGHLEEDCPVTKFSQNKRFSSVFADRPIKFKYSTMQPLKEGVNGVNRLATKGEKY